ncbi:NADH-dependent [FeFe] hydrogenase, group A6 [Vagococcus acidifermentans]|uniref:Ferredoxin n=1 Tax=Vagococcus acidifermentans TaxID=564710 RepID=A0A430AQS8_9ENTE|nr:NADH-dependent [FeFe] hydrogenase, group A6 [Vagococcus acidifermentans]RSU10257.1 ferredoxin [Vagococcus acidifermentans]
MANINLTINNQKVTVPSGTTVLDAARLSGITIPTLCYLKEVNAMGDCRICMVEVEGRKNLVASCMAPVEEGMVVHTNTPAVRKSRQLTLELLLSDHDKKCLSCFKSTSCELQLLSQEYNVDEDYFPARQNKVPIDMSSPYIVRDNNKCILCRRCVTACEEMQSIGAIGMVDRGHETHITCAFNYELGDSNCVGCGQCVVVCPVGALSERNHVDDAWDALNDPTKRVVVFTAPSIRAQLGEAFDYPLGTNVEGQMIAALRRLGFDEVFGMDVAADFTIVEEANELVERIQQGAEMPMFTSCCPGWVKFLEHNYPEMIPNLSTCKSPQQMFGALLKTYYCEKENIDPEDLVVVSIIPCTAKKFEVSRPEQLHSELQDVDIALTTRELAQMIKEMGLKFDKLQPEKPDNPFDVYSGAGSIFGASGGVLEAAIRTAGRMLSPDFDRTDIVEVRGTEGIKEAQYVIGDITIRVAAVSGLANARKIIEDVKSGRKQFDMIEIMACPGGCINGGGQVIPRDSVRNNYDVKALRAKALYDIDHHSLYRTSHSTPVVHAVYDEYLGKPGGEKAHELLHTSYVARARFGG